MEAVCSLGTYPSHVPPRWEDGFSSASPQGTALKQQTWTPVFPVKIPHALPHPHALSDCSCSAIRKPNHVPLHPQHHQVTLHLTLHSALSLLGDTRASRGNWEWPIPPSPARALQGSAPQRWRELSPVCESVAPAWPQEHGQLYFHCKLEINHSRKLPC